MSAQMPQDRLCTKCYAITSSEWDWSEENKIQHYAKGADFVKAAQSGCYFCAWALRTHCSFSSEPVYETYYRTEIIHASDEGLIDRWMLNIFTFIRSNRIESETHIFWG